MVRIKNRYIAVQIVPYTPTQTLRFSDQTLTKCLLQNVKKYYGVYGLGLLEHGFRVKYCNERTKIAIIRCLHRGQHFVSSMLPLITLARYVPSFELFIPEQPSFNAINSLLNTNDSS
ncbi:uncharacterized protein LOC115632261 isoform X2 [Scaptodrosophila lebanonensis]|uniref:Uncharacterized protein LOC115632261 isoform X2 n=1 Tax=Drosophila lebanonensis TaxID=7225 RepID=A0A6J2UDK2_DROLE|nr:uncharacterized protein LOC115632261 isoform X2 [Scaptodrosophila lebanonensis]